MKTIIIFDERSWRWDKNSDFIRASLEQSRSCLEGSLRSYGYLYLNDV